MHLLAARDFVDEDWIVMGYVALLHKGLGLRVVFVTCMQGVGDGILLSKTFLGLGCFALREICTNSSVHANKSGQQGRAGFGRPNWRFVAQQKGWPAG